MEVATPPLKRKAKAQKSVEAQVPRQNSAQQQTRLDNIEKKVDQILATITSLVEATTRASIDIAALTTRVEAIERHKNQVAPAPNVVAGAIFQQQQLPSNKVAGLTTTPSTHQATLAPPSHATIADGQAR